MPLGACPLDWTQHLLSNVMTVIENDEAWTRSYFRAQHMRSGARGGTIFTISGTYEDEMTRTAQGWRIRVRQLLVTGTEGNQLVMGERWVASSVAERPADVSWQ